jgi:hypothetical protein
MNQVMEDLGRLTGQLELLGEQVRQRRQAAVAQTCATGGQSSSEEGCSQ